MTIICYRNGILAADRLITTSDDYMVGEASKIFAAGPYIGGSCGTGYDCEMFKQWVIDGTPKEKPDLSDNFLGLLIHQNGAVQRLHQSLVSSGTIAQYHAVGSAQAIGVALGAFAFGATAEEAALACCKHALGCGGSIDVIRLIELGSTDQSHQTNQTSTMGT